MLMQKGYGNENSKSKERSKSVAPERGERLSHNHRFATLWGVPFFITSMKTIPLSQGKMALVDDEDFENLNQFKWVANEIGGTFYAQRNGPRLNGKKTIILMHRYLLNFLSGQDTDHRNHNGLDNQRENLRLCTHAENLRNRKLNKNNITGFKGVYYSIGKYKTKEYRYIRACIKFNSKTVHLGTFSNLESAAHAYDIKAKELFSEFALLNFPDRP